MSDCTDWWHSVTHGPGSLVLFGKRYTRKWSSGGSNGKGPSLPFEANIKSIIGELVSVWWKTFSAPKMKTPDSGKICSCSAKAIPTKEETASTETDKLFLRIPSPNMACWLLRVSHLGRGKHAVTGCDGKCLVGCTTNPPLGPISMQWEGVMGNGTLYISISTHYQAAHSAGKGLRIPVCSFPFATDRHQMPRTCPLAET